MAQHPIVSGSFAIAAAPTTILSRTGLARNYSRLDIAIRETGGVNAVTAATFEAGVGTAIKRDAVREAAIINAAQLGTTAGEYTLILTDEDVPDALTITLTSAATCVCTVNVYGTTRD